jgi:hypothetical protein
MLRWRILKSVAVIFPLMVVLGSPFLDPIRRRLLNRSDLRLFTTNDSTDRTQTIVIHNAGDVGLSKVFIGINVSREIERPVSDFFFASHESVPFTSFVETLAHSETWTRLPPADREKVGVIADDHSNIRTLYDLDQAFDSILIGKLQTNKSLASAVADLRATHGSYDDWHYVWLKGCEYNPSPNPACRQVDNALAEWEYTKRNLQMDAFKRWHEVTGVEIIPPSRRLSPNGMVYFVLPLGPDESGFVRIRYGPNSMPLSEPVIFSNPERKITRMNGERDLFASSLWIFGRYYPLLTLFWVVLIVACLRLVWPVIRPPALLPTYGVFNLALKTNDPNHWELASQRYKFYIFRVYRRLWARFKQTDVAHSPEEMFDFIRSCSISEKGNTLFQDQIDLNGFIGRKLEQLTRLP